MHLAMPISISIVIKTNRLPHIHGQWYLLFDPENHTYFLFYEILFTRFIAFINNLNCISQYFLEFFSFAFFVCISSLYFLMEVFPTFPILLFQDYFSVDTFCFRFSLSICGNILFVRCTFLIPRWNWIG